MRERLSDRENRDDINYDDEGINPVQAENMHKQGVGSTIKSGLRRSGKAQEESGRGFSPEKKAKGRGTDHRKCGYGVHQNGQ